MPEISGDSELHLAVQHGNIELVEVLLVRPVRPTDPDVRGKGEMTPLHLAVYHRHEDIMRMLLRHGADANLRNSSGRTPLHMASAHTSHAMVAMLLDWGADPRIRDHQGQVPLTHAGPDPGPELERMLAPAEGTVVISCCTLVPLLLSANCDRQTAPLALHRVAGHRDLLHLLHVGRLPLVAVPSRMQKVTARRRSS